MRRLMFMALMLCLVSLFTMGMEGMGADDKFPEPSKNYTATVVDTASVAHKVRKVSMEGKTYVTGLLGKASITIDFEKIDTVSVSPSEDKAYVDAKLKLRDGTTVEVKVRSLSKCYGETDLGNMSVRARDIKSIDFDEPVTSKDGE